MSADLDLTPSIAAKSDQLNADDIIAGPITVTISKVVKGSPEQPFDFQLVEKPGRAYRPSKTMRRVIVEAWGPDATKYAGRRLTLYREPSITFGGQKVGGIRISHMSDIAGPVVLAAQVTKGKRETFTVQPLAASSTPHTARSETDGGSGVSGGGTPALDPTSATTTGGGGGSAAGAPESESPAPEESLLDAITRQIGEIQAEGGSAHLKTWMAENGLGTSKRALAERFGEDARDLRALMGSVAS